MVSVAISRVSARLLSARSQTSVTSGIGTFDTFSMVLVEIEDDSGLIGYGEALARRGGEMTVAAVENLLRPVLLQKDPRNIGGLWMEMVNRLRLWGHTSGVVMEAISGVDIALWDLVGKLEGRPVWQLLAGAGRQELPVFASSVFVDSPEAMAAQAVSFVEQGFPIVKVKIARNQAQGGLDADIEALQAIRAAIGQNIGLVVDANGAFDTSEAIRAGRAMEPLNVGWFEEPVPVDDLGGYARVNAMTSTPLARGETDFGIFTISEVIRRRLIDVVRPDPGRCAGITGSMHIATLALSQNLLFAPHTGFSGGIAQLAGVHVAAAAPTLLSFEHMLIDNPCREIFVDGYLVPVDGLLKVPTGPGLGLELDHAKLDRFGETSKSN